MILLIRMSIVAASVALGLSWHSPEGTINASAIGEAAWGTVSGIREALGYKPMRTDLLLEALAAAVGFEIIEQMRRHKEDEQ